MHHRPRFLIGCCMPPTWGTHPCKYYHAFDASPAAFSYRLRRATHVGDYLPMRASALPSMTWWTHSRYIYVRLDMTMSELSNLSQDPAAVIHHSLTCVERTGLGLFEVEEVRFYFQAAAAFIVRRETESRWKALEHRLCRIALQVPPSQLQTLPVDKRKNARSRKS